MFVFTWKVGGWGPCGIAGCSQTARGPSQSCPVLPLERGTAGLQSWCSLQCLSVFHTVRCCAVPPCSEPRVTWPGVRLYRRWRPAYGHWEWRICCERQRSWVADCCWWMNRKHQLHLSVWWCWPRTAPSRRATAACHLHTACCARAVGSVWAGSNLKCRCWLAGWLPAPTFQTAWAAGMNVIERKLLLNCQVLI